MNSNMIHVPTCDGTIYTALLPPPPPPPRPSTAADAAKSFPSWCGGGGGGGGGFCGAGAAGSAITAAATATTMATPLPHPTACMPRQPRLSSALADVTLAIPEEANTTTSFQPCMRCAPRARSPGVPPARSTASM